MQRGVSRFKAEHGRSGETRTYVAGVERGKDHGQRCQRIQPRQKQVRHRVRRHGLLAVGVGLYVCAPVVNAALGHVGLRGRFPDLGGDGGIVAQVGEHADQLGLDIRRRLQVCVAQRPQTRRFELGLRFWDQGQNPCTRTVRLVAELVHHGGCHRRRHAADAAEGVDGGSEFVGVGRVEGHPNAFLARPRKPSRATTRQPRGR